jgi:hypothetical protein
MNGFEPARPLESDPEADAGDAAAGEACRTLHELIWLIYSALL